MRYNTLPFIFLILLISVNNYAQTRRVDVGKSYINVTKLNGGGTYEPGDTIEVRYTIAVRNQTNSTTIDSVQVTDMVPAKTTFIPGSIRIATNQGVTYKNFTDAFDTDAGYNSSGNIVINVGTHANNLRGGRIKSDSSKPRFNSTNCIMVACYRVRINPAVPYGDTITMNNGTVGYRRIATSPTIRFDTTFPRAFIKVTPNTSGCANGIGISQTAEFGGTFGSGATQNRGSFLAYPTTYAKQPVALYTPDDYYYAIVNNSSPTASTNPNLSLPHATGRVFNVWDINGDHTGSTTAAGNPPAAAGTNRGYFLLVNASFNSDAAYQETINNLCAQTYYEFSSWVRNMCPRCSTDSNGVQAANAGFIPFTGNDSSGVRPNLSFEINGLIYYTTGDVRYDRAAPWKKFGFSFSTGSAQTSANFTIKNNSPGGGGNDWAIDDITVAQCYPYLNMNYNPEYVGCKEATNVVTLSDTIRQAYPNNIYFQWQISNVGGTLWSNLTGPGTSGVGTPVLTGGSYQFVTTLPSFLTSPADSGRYYRVVIGTTAANLASASCSYTDPINRTLIKIITCGVILKTNVLNFDGHLLPDNSAVLNWKVDDEEDLDRYEIEKSADNISFKRLAGISITSQQHGEYRYVDAGPVVEYGFYRIKLIDKNGKFKLSKVILLGRKITSTVKLMNNPFAQDVDVQMTAASKGTVHAVLYDMLGRSIGQYTAILNKGLNEFSVSSNSKLGSGIYTLHIEFDKQVFRYKLPKN